MNIYLLLLVLRRLDLETKKERTATDTITITTVPSVLVRARTIPSNIRCIPFVAVFSKF
jgi:hypothetical protein